MSISGRLKSDRDQSARKLQMNFEAIIKKYSDPFLESDVIDMQDMTIVEDRGLIEGIKHEMKFGTAKLVCDKMTPHLSSCLHSTKDSSDSAIGSAQDSEGIDTSGVDGQQVDIRGRGHYKHRNARCTNAEKEILDDILTISFEDSEEEGDDSGNDKTDSECSGTAVSPYIGRSYYSSRCGNISRHDTTMSQNVADSKERSVDYDDPYDFGEQPPSILEQKNHFLTRMQTILMHSFSSDGNDDPDVGGLGPESKGSTENIATSDASDVDSVYSWYTLPSPHRTPRNDRRFSTTPQKACKTTTAVEEIEPCREDKTVLDISECSTIITGNLFAHHTPKVASKHGMGALSNKPICNSTMLSEKAEETDVNPSIDSKQHRSKVSVGMMGVLDCKHVSGVEKERPSLKYQSEKQQHHKSKTLRRRVDKSNTANAYGDTATGETNLIKEGLTGKLKQDRAQINTEVKPSQLELQMMSEKVNSQVNSESCDREATTPRVRLRKEKPRTRNLLYTQFKTEEIMEIFRSPKPLIIPGLDLKALEMTPRRRTKVKGANTPTTDTLRSALRRLQSPFVDRCKEPKRQPARGIISSEANFDESLSEKCISQELSPTSVRCSSNVHCETPTNKHVIGTKTDLKVKLESDLQKDCRRKISEKAGRRGVLEKSPPSANEFRIRDEKSSNRISVLDKRSIESLQQKDVKSSNPSGRQFKIVHERPRAGDDLTAESGGRSVRDDQLSQIDKTSKVSKYVYHDLPTKSRSCKKSIFKISQDVTTDEKDDVPKTPSSRRIKKAPLTRSAKESPSMLSSPFNCMSLTSPQVSNSLHTKYESITPKRSRYTRTKGRDFLEKKTPETLENDSTHVTIWDGTSSSDEPMLVDDLSHNAKPRSDKPNNRGSTEQRSINEKLKLTSKMLQKLTSSKACEVSDELRNSELSGIETRTPRSMSSRQKPHKHFCEANSRLVHRTEHTHHFSDEECNSSGDAAKFLFSLDAKPRKLYKTTEKVLPGRRKVGSPPTKRSPGSCHRPASRLAHSEKRHLNCASPKRSQRRSQHQSTRSAAPVGSSCGQRRVTTSTQECTESPHRKHWDDDDSTHDVSGKLGMFSPLCTKKNNVSSSYLCEGRGYCKKLFCFNCALE